MGGRRNDLAAVINDGDGNDYTYDDDDEYGNQ